MMEEELERLTDEINEQKEPGAFLLARRGALCRKVCLEFLYVFLSLHMERGLFYWVIMTIS